jgi:hypothetical protein
LTGKPQFIQIVGEILFGLSFSLALAIFVHFFLWVMRLNNNGIVSTLWAFAYLNAVTIIQFGEEGWRQIFTLWLVWILVTAIAKRQGILRRQAFIILALGWYWCAPMFRVLFSENSTAAIP